MGLTVPRQALAWRQFCTWNNRCQTEERAGPSLFFSHGPHPPQSGHVFSCHDSGTEFITFPGGPHGNVASVHECYWARLRKGPSPIWAMQGTGKLALPLPPPGPQLPGSGSLCKAEILFACINCANHISISVTGVTELLSFPARVSKQGDRWWPPRKSSLASRDHTCQSHSLILNANLTLNAQRGGEEVPLRSPQTEKIIPFL
jgi:hypothetical protein